MIVMSDINIDLPPLYNLQKYILEDKTRFKVLACGRRFGKCIDIETEIPTIDGFKTMENINVGDIVFGEDGKPTTVTFVSDIYYNHKCYEITFTDGNKIIADENHQWLTYTKLNRKSINRGFENCQTPTVKTTLEIKNSIYHGKEINHTIPLCDPIEYNTKKLILNPYLLGLWLGDGATKDSILSGEFNDIEFYKEEFLKSGFKLVHVANYDYRIKSDGDIPKYNIFRRKLTDLNVLRNKHIPDEYLYGDIYQRLELLRGLMDTDGTYGKNNMCEFYTSNKDFANQVYTLITSLGIRAKINTKSAKIGLVDYGICYRIGFTSRNLIVFKLPRKVKLQESNNSNNWFSNHRGIKCIKEVKSVPVRCISVDNKSHLYLITKSYIATHNTRLCAVEAFRTAAKGKKVWWVGPVYSVSMIGWRLLLMMVRQLPKEMGITINVADKTILWPNGGLISFKSGDHPENLRGEGLDLLIMDEADFCKEMVWTEVLRPALADRKGRAIFISTPYIEGGWFHKLYMSGYKGNPEKYEYYNVPNELDKDVKSFQFSSYCNPYLDSKEIDKAKNSSTAIVFQREFMAWFVSAAGARVKKEYLQYVAKYPLTINVALGMDLAISEKTTADYTAICVIAQEKTLGDVYILEVQRGRWSFAKQKEEIIRMANKYYHLDSDLKIGIEGMNYQKALIQEVSRECKYPIISVPSNKDKISKFAPMESKFEHKQVYLMNGLPLEFESELLSFPVGKHDDMVDALGFAYYTVGKINNCDAAPIIFRKENKFRKF